jgi:tetratricopeptide (TPR) repeat protein
MKLIRFIVLTASLVLGACAQVPVKPEAAAKPPAAATQPADAQTLPKVVTRTPSPRAVPLPRIELSEVILFKLTLAEIAAQRGQPHVAVPAFLEVARETRDPRIARRAAEIAWNARFLPAALEAATLWLQADPESMRAQQTVIALLVNQSRLEDAMPHLEKWLNGDAQRTGQNFMQISTLVAGHKDKPAIFQLMRKLAAQHPSVPEASLALAQAAWNADELVAALDAARNALRLRPGWELAALFQAQVLQRDSAAAAIDFLEDFVKAYPGARDARLNYARLLVSVRRYPDARKQFEILLGEAPNNAEIAMAVATLSMQAKDYVAAEAQLRRALEIKPKDPDAVRLYLGQVNEELKRDDEALKWYASITHGAQFVPAQARYAGVLARQGNLAAARKHLQDVSAGDAQQRTQLTLAEANLLRDANAYQEAFDFLSQAVARTPDAPDLLYDHAMAAEKVNRVDILEANLRKVIKMRPDHAHAYNALGYTLADRNQRLPEAHTLIETAHKLAPEDPYILDSLGWVLHRLGRNQEALGYLQRSYDLRPDAEIAAHLGEVLWVLGRQEEAQKLWTNALREHAKNELLKSTVKRLAPVILQSAQ